MDTAPDSGTWLWLWLMHRLSLSLSLSLSLVLLLLLRLQREVRGWTALLLGRNFIRREKHLHLHNLATLPK